MVTLGYFQLRACVNCSQGSVLLELIVIVHVCLYLFLEKLGIPVIDYPRATKLVILEKSDYVDQNKEAYELRTYVCADLVSIKGRIVLSS